VQRDPRYFSPDPDTFLPERWLPDEGPKLAAAAGQEYVLKQAAYIPFSYGLFPVLVTLPSLIGVKGPGNCVGRALALHEMRAALAMLIRGFDVRLAPGFTPEQWTDALRDAFVLVRGALQVELSERVLA
jgi:cytochrome P450